MMLATGVACLALAALLVFFARPVADNSVSRFANLAFMSDLYALGATTLLAFGTAFTVAGLAGLVI